MALVPLYSPVAFSGALPCSLKRDPSVVTLVPGEFVRFDALYLPVMLGPTSQERFRLVASPYTQLTTLERSMARITDMLTTMVKTVNPMCRKHLALMHQDQVPSLENRPLFSLLLWNFYPVSKLDARQKA